MNSVLNDAVERTLAEQDYFGADGPVPAWAEYGHPKFTVVTGDNASGKSLLCRAVAEKLREAHPKLEVIPVTMNGRSRAGIERLAIWGDESRQSTGHLSVRAVLGGLRTCRERSNDHVLVLDEPDIGLAESYSAALGAYLAAFVEDMPVRTRGVIVVTHSRPLVNGLMGVEPTSIRVGDDPRPLARWLREGPVPRSIEDIEALAERSSATSSGINRVRNARMEAKGPGGPRP
jgi:hypothetical protein